LDNLPHDRIEAMGGPSGGIALHEAHVVAAAGSSNNSSNNGGSSGGGYNGGAWVEELRPLTDPLLVRCLALRPGLAEALLAAANPSGIRGLASGVASGVAALLQGRWPFSGTAQPPAPQPTGPAAPAPHNKPTAQALAHSSEGHAAAFVPTGCLALLHELHACFPRHALLLADFDSLPPPDLSWVHLAHLVQPKGRAEAEVAADAALEFIAAGASPLGSLGAPLVSERVHSGANRDHPTYLVPMGAADILFPTAFDWVAALYRGAAEDAATQRVVAVDPGTREAAQSATDAASVATTEAEVQQRVTTAVVKQRVFLEAHTLDRRLTTTRSGYNPFLMDFANTTVFVGEVDGHEAPQK
jgi:hypothetical protein